MRTSWKKVTEVSHFAVCIFLIILVSACGGGSDTSYETSSDTGSIAFSVEWRGAPTESSGRYAVALDCAAAGVSIVEGKVYDSYYNNYLGGGGPWDCEAHAGTIYGVSAGTGSRTVVILGKDSSGTVLYRGELINVTVEPGITNYVGDIVAELFSPTLLSPSDSSALTSIDIDFEWNPTQGATEYRLQISTDSSFTSLVIDEASAISPFPVTLSGGTYYWRVRPIDSYGNEGMWSEVWSFAVSSQVWRTSYDFPETYIEERWNEGYGITSVAYGDALWAVVMSQGTDYYLQAWATRIEFPETYINDRWIEGYYITSLAYGNGLWAVVMSKGTGYTDQWWKTDSIFPEDFINDRWNEGYYITSLAYGDGLWAVVMSQGTDYTYQWWKTESTFPVDFINGKWDEGFAITSVAYGDGLWAVVMSE